jgi:SynChlorMet cassette radical SAM/SPASM protein ScmF
MRLHAETPADIGAIPPLTQLYVYLTEGCNLACRHCWIAPAFDQDGAAAPALPPVLFERVVAEARPLGLSRVKLTGGEPLLHPRFAEILEAVRRENLGLTVETNGLLCTDEVAAAMAQCRDPFVSVSLDGAVAATHERIRGVGGCFARSLEGTRALVRAGIKPQIVMTLQRGNAGEAEGLVGLARGLGAASVKFNVLQPTARGSRLHAAGEALGVEEVIALGRRFEGAGAQPPGIGVIFDYPAAFRSLRDIAAAGGCDRCGILNIIGVLATGKYALCGIGELVPRLVFGVAGEDRLADVWTAHPALRELRAGLPARLRGVCGRCLMRGSCLGSCLAQTYYRTGSFWEPSWFCEAAERGGLFPRSRLAATRTGRVRCAGETPGLP